MRREIVLNLTKREVHWIRLALEMYIYFRSYPGEKEMVEFIDDLVDYLGEEEELFSN